MYRQSPVKSPDIKNVIVVTFTFLLKVPHCMEVTYIRAKVPNSFSRRLFNPYTSKSVIKGVYKSTCSTTASWLMTMAGW